MDRQTLTALRSIKLAAMEMADPKAQTYPTQPWAWRNRTENLIRSRGLFNPFTYRIFSALTRINAN